MTRASSSTMLSMLECPAKPNAVLSGSSKASGLLNVKQAAEYLNISRSHLYDLIKAGQVARLKIGRRTLFTTRDLDAFATELRSKSNHP